MKYGLDFHGVIDTYPQQFSELSHTWAQNKHEVHIVTGTMITDAFIEKLQDFDIHFDKLFSIADHLIQHKRKVHFSSPDNPWFDESSWRKQKGLYCKRELIDMHFDDGEEYAQYFEPPTIFVLVKPPIIHVNEEIC